MEFPITIRMPYGGGVRAPELRDARRRPTTCTPGVKSQSPRHLRMRRDCSPRVRDPDPVVVFEPKLHYRTMRGEVPEGEHVVPLRRALRARGPTFLVAYGAIVPLCEEVADALEEEASIEVLIRSLKPLDEESAPGIRREDRTDGDRPGGAAGGRLRAPSWRRSSPRRSSTCAGRAARHRLRRPVSVLANRDYMPSVERVGAAVRKLQDATWLGGRWSGGVSTCR